MFLLFFFFNDTATTEIYTLSLHDALPISRCRRRSARIRSRWTLAASRRLRGALSLGRRASSASRRFGVGRPLPGDSARSGEHTSELQSRQYIVCRLLLGKKKNKFKTSSHL